MSAAIVTGSFALISSALTYWTNLSTSNGYTADAYLTTPVGVDSLELWQTRLQEPLGLEQPERHQRDSGMDGCAFCRHQRLRQHVHPAQPAG